MYFKKGLLLILFTLILITPVFGNDVNNIDVPSVHFFQKYFYEKGTQGKSLFLYSQSEMNSTHTGNITLFQSDITIRGEFRGNIYAYFSTVHIEEGASIAGKVFTLSSEVYLSEEGNAQVVPVFTFLNSFREIYNSEGYEIYNDRLHIILIYVIVGILRELACLVILALKKGFIEQGSVLLVYEPMSVIQNGLMTYFVFLSLIIIFFASVVGFPLAVFIFIVVFLMFIVGQTSLNMFVGNMVLEKIGVKRGTYANILVGGTLVEIISFVPFIRYIVNFLFMPMICLGVLTTNVVNGFLKRKYYEVDYSSGKKEENKTNIDDIRKIIMKDII